MLKQLILAATVGVIAACGGGSVNAQSLPSVEEESLLSGSLPITSYTNNPEILSAPDSIVPESAFFVALGGGLSSVQFTQQKLYFIGVSDVFDEETGEPVASGWADGSIDPMVDASFGLAPVVQAGYFRHFSDSDWLWGGKFSYSYVGAKSSTQKLFVPQNGSFSNGGTTPFTGNEEVELFQSSLTNRMSLIAFLGHSFEKSFIYVGGGPTWSQTTSTLNGVVGFADIDGQHVSITGVTTPEHFSNSQWVAGGDVVVGVTYFLDPSWFLDISYTFGVSAKQTASFSAPFSNTEQGYVTEGTNSGTYTERALTQLITVSVGNAF